MKSKNLTLETALLIREINGLFQKRQKNTLHTKEDEYDLFET